MGATFNTLPSLTNLVRWNLSNDASCKLCGSKVCTIPHILSGCDFARNNGRYTFRHDSVLLEFLKEIQNLIDRKKSKKIPSKGIAFVPAGQKPKARREHHGLIDKAKDWTLITDIGDSTLIFPTSIAITLERPDIVIYSEKTKTVIMIENTSGCEENFPGAHSGKVERYQNLMEEIEENGWRGYLFAVEVGARGYCAKSVPYCLKSLEVSPSAARKITKSLGLIAMKLMFFHHLACSG